MDEERQRAKMSDSRRNGTTESRVGFQMRKRERLEGTERQRETEKLNGISDEWAISHCLLASCCDCVSMVIISISDINPASTALTALLTN